jgi:transcriptional regulator with XRE-family HTH domain
MPKKAREFNGSLANVILLRRRDGLSQAELASLIGRTQQAVARWEGGTAVPTTKDAVAIADVFDVPLEVVIGRKPVPERRKTLDEKMEEFRALDLGLPQADRVDVLTRQVFQNYAGRPEHLAKVCAGIEAVVDMERAGGPDSITSLVEAILAA